MVVVAAVEVHFLQTTGDLRRHFGIESVNIPKPSQRSSSHSEKDVRMSLVDWPSQASHR
jgi:hypothetical protein